MKLSRLMTKDNTDPLFPARGRNGYGGEQDGSHPVLFGFIFDSRKEADEVFPSGLPEGIEVNWTRFHPPLPGGVDGYWEVCVGWWSTYPPEPEKEKKFREVHFQRGKLLRTF